MTQSEIAPKTHIIETECKLCGKLVSFEVDDKVRGRYPFSFMFYHGQPLHALISYIDKNYRVRSSEVVQEFAGMITLPADKVTKKCVVTGDWGVGKTTFIQKIIKNVFVEDYDPTVVTSVSECVFLLSNKTAINFQFWDAAGQHSTLGKDSGWQNYVSGADIAIIIADVTKPSTFKILGDLVRNLQTYAKWHCLIIGIANKIDLVRERKITHEEVAKLEKEYGIPIVELTLKNGGKFDDFFNHLLYDLQNNLELA